MKNSLYIITGCSKGLGKALTDELVKVPENQVVGISRSVMGRMENFHHIPLDLGDTQSVIGNLVEIFPSGEFEKIVMINNAGWIGDIAPLGKLDPNGIALIHATNLIAPAILMNEFVKQYGASKAERVVLNISSGAASKAIDGWSGYCSSKAALNQLTLVAEEESKLKRLGIKYYALSPGIIDTSMQRDIRSSLPENFSNRDKFRSFQKNGELDAPEETAEKILYLINNSRKFEEVLQDVREY